MKEFNYKEFQKECEFEEYMKSISESAFRIIHIESGTEEIVHFNKGQTRYNAYKRLFDKVYGGEE